MAVIVAGIAGASVAHHFHQFALLAQPLNITVFEEEVRADFWIKSAHVYGELFKDIDVGAVAFSEEDWCLVQAMEEVRLKPASDGNDKKHVVAWDGDDFIVLSSLNNGSTSRWWQSVKLLWRYGMSPFRTQPVFQTVFEKMRSFAMYQLYRNLQESLHRRSLDSEISVSAVTFFSKSRLITNKFINEVIRPGTRHAFSQDLEDANALSALIALREARPVAIDGGNWRLPHRMFKTSEANVELNTPLIRISPDFIRRWMVDIKDITQPKHMYLRSGMEEFDIIILTVPFQSNTIEIESPFRTLKAPFLKQNNTALPLYVTRLL